MNGLREVESIYTSTAVMIGRKQMANVEKQRILDRLMLRLDAVMKLPPINTSCSTSPPRNIWNRWLTSSVV